MGRSIIRQLRSLQKVRHAFLSLLLLLFSAVKCAETIINGAAISESGIYFGTVAVCLSLPIPHVLVKKTHPNYVKVNHKHWIFQVYVQLSENLENAEYPESYFLVSWLLGCVQNNNLFPVCLLCYDVILLSEGGGGWGGGGGGVSIKCSFRTNIYAGQQSFFSFLFRDIIYASLFHILSFNFSFHLQFMEQIQLLIWSSETELSCSSYKQQTLFDIALLRLKAPSNKLCFRKRLVLKSTIENFRQDARTPTANMFPPSFRLGFPEGKINVLNSTVPAKKEERSFLAFYEG